MKESYDQFKTMMEENTDGHTVEIHFGKGLNDKYPAIRLFEYTDYPKSGLFSIVTYGVSEASCNQWKTEKPEFILTINSHFDQWSGFLGLITDLRRGQSDFREGYCCCSLAPITESSKLQGLCFGGTVNMPINPIPLTDKRIIIRLAFPIYLGEIEIINRQGIKWFIEKVGKENLSDLRRPDLSSGVILKESDKDLIDFIQIEELGSEIGEEKRASDKIDDILKNAIEGKFNPHELKNVCVNLSTLEKKMLGEITLFYYNQPGPKSHVALLLIFMFQFADGIEPMFNSGGPILKVFDEAEKAFKEENWDKAENLYWKLVDIVLFDGYYVQQNIGICQINKLTDIKSDKINEIKTLIDILITAGENNKAAIVSEKLNERLALIKGGK